MANIVFDYTNNFIPLYIGSDSSTHNKMYQSAMSGKQNTIEASMASETSKEAEIKLLEAARASFEVLLACYKDFLRQRHLSIWPKSAIEVHAIRKLSYISNKSYSTYESYINSPESAANCALCLIHQTIFLLDRQADDL